MPATQRRLAAILAADIAGFSRLMGADEEATLRALEGHRAVLDAAITEHRGRIFHTAGDSVVAEFTSPVDAVRCAVEAQRAVADRNAMLPLEQRMAFRMGVNLGDVMVQGSNLLGDAVNIAARLEGIAEPGGICISRAIQEQVRAALPLDYIHAGKRTLKNIMQPVDVYRVMPPRSAARRAPIRPRRVAMIMGAVLGLAAAGGVVAWQATGLGFRATAPPLRASLVPDRPSIAVLPFSNMSGDSGQDYFSDGMTEDLITDLSKISGMSVTARNSAYVYKGRATNVADVGRELGVRYVLEGSVRKVEQRIRITAQLSDATTGRQLWAERYDREITDVFDLQDDVRQKIVAALAVKLSPEEAARLARKPTQNVEAYDLWMRGQEYMTRFTVEDNREARAMFLRAVALDPSFARAYGQIANTYSLEVENGWSHAPAEAAANSVLYAQYAVMLDDGLPEARWPLSRAYAWHGRTDRALAEIERTLAIQPNYADGLAYYGLLLSYVGRAAEGLGHADRAIKLNPHHPFWYANIYGSIQYLLGNYEEAVTHLRKALERSHGWTPARRMLVAAYGQLGRIDDAMWEVEELRALGVELSIAEFHRQSPFQGPEARERIVEGLRKAGVPE